MLKKVLPVAVAALLLSAGGAFAKRSHSATPSEIPGVGHHELEQITATEMVSMTGKGADCTDHVQQLGRDVIVVGLVGLNHILVITGQVTVGLAPFVCAL